jgi:hypothetical protein
VDGPLTVTEVAPPVVAAGALRATVMTPETPEFAALTAAMVTVDEEGMLAGAA